MNTNYNNDGCVRAVWLKAKKINGKNPAIWMIDVMGKKIKFEYLNNVHSRYAWQIDHKIPQTRGGSDDIENLQPMNRADNIRFGNKLDRNKPGYDKRDHFNLLISETDIAKHTILRTMKFKKGMMVMARQSRV